MILALIVFVFLVSDYILLCTWFWFSHAVILTSYTPDDVRGDDLLYYIDFQVDSML